MIPLVPTRTHFSCDSDPASRLAPSASSAARTTSKPSVSTSESGFYGMVAVGGDSLAAYKRSLARLYQWGRHPELLVDEDVEPPTIHGIRTAINTINRIRTDLECWRMPNLAFQGIGVGADGVIGIHLRKFELGVSFYVHGNGVVEKILSIGPKLLYREIEHEMSDPQE